MADNIPLKRCATPSCSAAGFYRSAVNRQLLEDKRLRFCVAGPIRVHSPLGPATIATESWRSHRCRSAVDIDEATIGLQSLLQLMQRNWTDFVVLWTEVGERSIETRTARREAGQLGRTPTTPQKDNMRQTYTTSREMTCTWWSGVRGSSLPKHSSCRALSTMARGGELVPGVDASAP